MIRPAQTKTARKGDGLASRTANFIAIIVILSSLVGGIVVTAKNLVTQINDIEENTGNMIGAIAPIVEYSVWVFEEESIGILADSIQSLSFVRHVEIADNARIVSVSAGETYADDCTFCLRNAMARILPPERTVPLHDVRDQDIVIGQMLITIDYSDVLENLISHLLFLIFFVAVQSLLIFQVIFKYVGGSLISPLQLVSDLMRKIGLRQPLTQTELRQLDAYADRNDEVGAAVRSLATTNALISAYNQDLEKAIEERTTELIAAKDEAQSAALAKSEFVANISHEIRTPLGAIVNLTQLLETTALTPRQRDYVSNISVSGDLLMRLVNDVLDFSKVSQSDFGVRQEDFNLHETIDRVIAQFRHIAKKKGLGFEVYRQFPGDLICKGDQFRLEQILLNLLGNSFKFTSQGRVSLRIVQSVSDSAQIRFYVSDTGIGIEQKNAETIFSVFEQADSTITKRFGGTGLGLAISKQLVERMGGTIRLRSKPGRGTCISFGLPLVQSQEQGSLKKIRPEIDIAVLTRDVRFYRRIAAFCRAAGFAVPKLYASDARFKAAIQDAAGMRVFRDPRLDHPQGAEPADFPDRLAFFHVGDDADKITWLDLPLKWPDFTKCLSDGPRDDAPATDRRPAGDQPLSGMHFLVAEDNHINQFTFKELLANAGATCTVVENGQLAVAALEQESFDAVLMDIQMPVMDGHTATQLLRNDPRFTDLPIIALTAATSGLSDIKVGPGHFTAFLVKPLLIDQLLQVFENLASPEQQTPQADPASKPQTPMRSFDPEACLQAAGQNDALARRIMDEFASHYGDVADPADLDTATPEELETCRLFYHTLRGLSLTVGAQHLSQLAKSLEEQIARTGVLPDKADRIACQMALTESCRAIRAYLEGADTPEPAVKPVDDPQVQHELLEDLLQRARQGRADAYEAALELQPTGPEVQEIQQLLRRFEFDAAVKLIEQQLALAEQ